MPAVLLGAPNTRAATPNLVERGIRQVWATELPRWDTGVLEEFYKVTGSVKKLESDVVFAELGQALVKAEGASPSYDNSQEVWKVQSTHLTWALAVEITEEAIEDNLYLDMASRFGTSLARSMAYTRQVQAHDFLNDLTLTIYTVGGTNYPILSTTHFLLTGGTWANRPVNPAALSVASLEERLQAWNVNMVDLRGLKIKSRPSILLVGASNEFLAHRLLSSPYRPQSADNDLNPIKDLRSIRYVMSPHLTDDGRWFLLANPGETGFTQFDRVSPELRKYDTTDNGNLRMRARMRISHFCPHAFGTMGSP